MVRVFSSFLNARRQNYIEGFRRMRDGMVQGAVATWRPVRYTPSGARSLPLPSARYHPYFNRLPVLQNIFTLSNQILTYLASQHISSAKFHHKIPIFSDGENIPTPPQI